MEANTLDEWLDWLENYKDTNIELGLDRISLVAKKLKLNATQCPVITVAGTNGKGSTVAVLETIGMAAGLQVGSYTSPHLFSFNERIKINGIPITAQECINSFQIIKNNIPKKIILTYFEVATLVALMVFQKHVLDLVVLEVGLGGRLDAVNIINNQISIITSIALEHCQYLGNTVESIAQEKAGIIKPNSITICAAQNAYDVIQQKTCICNSKLMQLDKYFFVEQQENVWSYRSEKRTINSLSITSFPIQNAACAIAAIDALGLNISTQQIKQAIANVQVLGRFQIYRGPCDVILDVAHNPEAAMWLANKVTTKSTRGKTKAIISICVDKDWRNIIKPFLHFVDEWYTVSINNPRLLKANVLAENIKTLTSKSVFSCSNVENAVECSINQSLSIDRILVFGSFFTVAAVLKYINEKNYGDNN